MDDVQEGGESDIAARIRAGDDTAFSELFRAHYANLVGYAASFLADQDIAEEVVCDVFAWLHVHRATWNPANGTRAYLFRAVRNQLLNRQRAEQREYARRAALSIDIQSDPPRPDDILLDEEAQHALGRALAHAFSTLSPLTREIIALRWTHALSYDDIAHTLGVAPGAVRMQVSRALKLLRERLPSDLAP